MMRYILISLVLEIPRLIKGYAYEVKYNGGVGVVDLDCYLQQQMVCSILMIYLVCVAYAVDFYLHSMYIHVEK